MPQGTALSRRSRGGTPARTPPGQRVMRVVDATPVWAWTGAIVGALLMTTLFWGGTIGVADDGSGTHLACRVGVEAPDGSGEFVSLHLDPQQWSPDACHSGGLPSSHEVLVRSTMAIGRLIGFGGGLDLRVLGVVSVALAAAATMAWTRAVPGPAPVKAIAGLGVGIVLADGGVGPLFVSLHSHSVTVLGLVGLMAAWVSPRRSTRWLAICGIVVLASGPHLGPMALMLALATMTSRLRVEEGSLRRAAHRIGGIAIAGLFVAVSALAATPSPERTSISGQHSESVWAEGEGADPGVLLDRHRDLAEAAVMVRDGGYGNLPAEAGTSPRATACRLCVVSNLLPGLAPVAGLLLPVFWFVGIRIGLQLIARARRAREPALGPLGELVVLLPTLAMALHGYRVLAGGVSAPVGDQIVNSLTNLLILPVLVPAGWATYTLGVRLGEKPGLLRQLGSRFAAALTAPGPLTLPAHVSEPGRVTLPALITLPGRVTGCLDPVIVHVPETTGSGSWTGLEVWSDRLAHADLLRRPELCLRPASIPWARPRATSSGVAVGSTLFDRRADGDLSRRCRVARTRWLTPTGCGRRRSHIARGRAPPRGPPTIRGGRAPPTPALLTRACRYRAPP